MTSSSSINSTDASLAASIGSMLSSLSRQRRQHPHPLYSIRDQASCTSDDDDFEPVSRFSSCSTSPNSSFESLSSHDFGSCPTSSTPVRLSSSSSGSTFSFRSTGLRYADDHYPLITSVASGSNFEATLVTMAHAHNTLIRAVNSCYNHAKTVTEEQISDYLLFSQTLFNTISQFLKIHQDVVEPILQRTTFQSHTRPRRSLMIFQNSEFVTPFHAWAHHIHNHDDNDLFFGDYVISLLNRFAPLLVQHLHDTVSVLGGLVTMKTLSTTQLHKIWSVINQSMVDNLDVETDMILLFGSQDRRFKINGKTQTEDFPAVAATTALKVRRWHSRQNKRVWTFCSSDFSGRRRLLRE